LAHRTKTDKFIDRLFGAEDKREEEVRDFTPQSEKDVKAATENWAAYERSRDAGHSDWVEVARKCDNYYNGDQWEADIVDQLDAQNRPHITVNQILSTVNQVLGEHIKTRQEITFKPRGKGATEQAATALSSVIKQIQYNNHSQWNEQQVVADGIIEDRGYFDIRIDFSDNTMGEIREVIRDPRDILLDPGAKEYDPATWKEVITTRWLTPDEIEVLWGTDKADRLRMRQGATARLSYDSINFEMPTATFGGNDLPAGTLDETDDDFTKVHRIRVLERQHKKFALARFFVDKEEGDKRRVPENWEEQKVQDFAFEHDLELVSNPQLRIRWTVSADDVLLEDDWSLYERFTVIPYFPYFRRGKPHGLVRHLLSPQDMLNKISSQELHVVNTTANSGWVFEEGSLVNMDANELEEIGARTGLVIEHKRGTERPEKIPANEIPSGLNHIAQKAQVFFRQVSGLPDGFMGTSTREVSGTAMSAQKGAGSQSLEVIFDNLAKTRQMRAEFMLELIQNWYTETRLVQVTELDMDGRETDTSTTINDREVDNEGVETILNDLTVGEYGVIVVAIPHAETEADTIFSQALEMREAGVTIPDWVLIENSRLPNRNEVSEIVKKMQGAAEPTQQELEIAQKQQMLQLATQEAQVRVLSGKAAESEARATLLLAEAKNEESAPLREMQIAGAESRMQLDAMADKLKSEREAIEARLAISAQKADTERFGIQAESLTKRLSTVSKQQTDLAKIASQPRASSPK
jgi:hypothetical protein